MPIRFSTELEAYNCPLSVVEFDELLCNAANIVAPELNTERFLFHPKVSLIVCDIIRHRTGCQFPDDLILGRLQNVRKNGSGMLNDKNRE